MRLTLVISSLGCGGAERVMTTMANYWAAKDWDITLLTLDDGRVAPFYDLDSRVRHIPLALARLSRTPLAATKNNLKRISALRCAITASKPDAVISFVDKMNVITLLATCRLNVPVIVSEHSDPVKNSPGKIWERLRLLTYSWANLIVVLSQSALEYFSPNLRSRTRIIPNPIVMPAGGREQGYKDSAKCLVAMGRLVHLKGFDLLLRALALIKDKHPDWTLTILGEGPSRSELELLRERLGLEGRVALPGKVKDPDTFLQEASLFVMSSRYEGFPMALCEAMAAGLPVICTDCSNAGIIRDSVDGLLVPIENVEALSRTMDILMGDEAQRKRLASRAPDVVERFAIERVMRMWEEALSFNTHLSKVVRNVNR